jgi:tRNA pseudouridine32 synthase / 23S rRNA pseudouridine746 synthase
VRAAPDSSHPQPAHGLPTTNGIGPSCTFLPPGSWPTITDFLVQKFPAISREIWAERMASGLVADEFGQAVTPQRPYQSQLRIYYYRGVPNEARIPFDEVLLHVDAQLVVADKPHFLPVTPSGSYLNETLLVRLKKRLNIDTLVPLHRIDRETAGVVVFGVQPSQRNAYAELFRQHRITKHYEAIAPFRAELQFPLERKSRIVEDTPFFRQRETQGPPNSHTRIELIEQRAGLAKYALSPITGKKHQLRVHMNALGLPIANDRMYPPVAHTPGDDYRHPLQLLAKSIEFTDPITGQLRRFSSGFRLAEG